MPRSLSRQDNHRKSLVRNLSTSVILYEEIKTTITKAKEIRPIVEGLINRAKKSDSLTARRYLMSFLFDENAVKKVIEVLVPRYNKIDSGFVSIYKIGPRLGDGAEMAMVRLTPEKKEIKKENAQSTKGSAEGKSKEEASAAKKTTK